jgi:hypothetical protein
MKNFVEILQLIAQLIPIIEAAFAAFGNSQDATDLVAAALPPGLPDAHVAHLMKFAGIHLGLLEKKAAL